MKPGDSAAFPVPAQASAHGMDLHTYIAVEMMKACVEKYGHDLNSLRLAAERSVTAAHCLLEALEK